MWFAYLLAVVIVFFILFYKYCVQPHSYWRNKGIIQGKPIWFFGENWKLVSKQESFSDSILRIYNKFPNVRYFGTYQFNRPIFVIRDPELIKKITIKDFEHFVDHRVWIPVTSDPIAMHTLLFLKGDKWKEMRSFLSPAFTGSKMRTMFGLMKDVSESFINYLDNEDLKELDFKDTFHRYTCDVIATTAFGIKVDSLQNRNNDFYHYALKVGNFTGFRQWLFFLSFFLSDSVIKLFNIRFFTEKVANFFGGIVQETIKAREKKGIIRPDMIHLMMRAKKGLHEYDETELENIAISKAPEIEITNDTITAQAMIFILGGLDTVAIFMSFLVYELTVNPEIQDKLRREIIKTLENCKNGLTYEDVQKMKYMDMVVSEGLRKWPQGLVLDRICNKPYTIPPADPNENEIVLEPGTLIWIPVMGIHHDPNFYSNPEKFDPERFSDENKDKVHPYTFLPFGEGPRNCIGNRYALLNTKVILFNLLKSYELFPVAKSSIPIKVTKSTFLLDGDSFIFGLKKIN